MKREQFLDELEVVDQRALLISNSNKWQQVSDNLMRLHISPCYRDAAACKSKWNQVIPEYKRIVDFFARTGTNELSYWDFSVAAKKSEGLSKSFPQEIFFAIHDWYSSTPSVNPPHTRDMMAAGDSNYDPTVNVQALTLAGLASDNDSEDPLALEVPVDFDADSRESPVLPT